MIKWNCNFNIPNSTVQLAEAFIKVVDYKNINNNSFVDIIISDETGNIIVKEYSQKFEKNFNNIDEVYEELLLLFENSKLI